MVGHVVPQDKKVTCDRATFAVDANDDILITALAPSSGTNITNTADIISSLSDPNETNNTDDVSFDVLYRADLSITKSVASPVLSGTTTQFTLQPRNAGPLTAEDVKVIDTLPTGFNYISHTGAGWSCDTNTATITCSRNTYAVGAADDIVITTSVPASGSDIVNSARVESTTPDTETVNNSDDVTFDIATGSDVTISKLLNTAAIYPDEDVEFTLQPRNLGPLPAAGVVVTDVLPPGFIYKSAVGSGWTCSISLQTVSCARTDGGDYLVGASDDITLLTTGPSSGAFSNSASISTGSTDHNLTNNTGSVSGAVLTGANLSLNKSVSLPVIANKTTEFTFTVGNIGPEVASNTKIIDSLPAGFVYQSVVSDSNNWSCSANGQEVSCNTASMGSRTTDTVTITTSVPSSGSNITNSAIISSDIADPITGDNSDNVQFSIIGGADLTLSKSKTPTPSLPVNNLKPQLVELTSNMVSAITVQNLGPLVTSGTLTIEDTLASGESFVSGGNANWSCNHTGSTPGGLVKCSYTATGASLAVDASSTVEIITEVTNTGELTNTATVSDVSGEIDSIMGNNTASAALTGAKSTDLSIVKTVSTTALAGNETSLVYSLTVTNGGVNVITGDGAINIRDVIPGIVSNVTDATPSDTGIGVTSVGGTKFDCSGTAIINCSLISGQSFASGDSEVINITVSRPIAEGVLTNTATVSSDTYFDTDWSNNSSSVTTTVTAVADVEMQAANIPKTTVTARDEAIIVLQFKNNGPSKAEGIVISNTFVKPAARSYEFIEAVTSKGVCSVFANDSFTCDSFDLDRDENHTITIKVVPNSDANLAEWELKLSSEISTTTEESILDDDKNKQTAILTVEPAKTDLLVNNTDLSDPLVWVAAPSAFSLQP